MCAYISAGVCLPLSIYKSLLEKSAGTESTTETYWGAHTTS